MNYENGKPLMPKADNRFRLVGRRWAYRLHEARLELDTLDKNTRRKVDLIFQSLFGMGFPALSRAMESKSGEVGAGSDRPWFMPDWSLNLVER